ncbi:MAG: hypothetical protein N2491_04915 [Negativicutes bacterium]|nr:hypothetical protein [Negativicutes bacterium]
MLRHKPAVLLLVTILVALSGTLVWYYLFDDFPKKAPARAKQVMYFYGEHKSV